MKAAVLKSFGSPLAIEALPDPILGTGEVIVDVVAAPVVSYANEAFSGARGFLLDLPLAPGAGAIGRVRAVGPDATRLAAGDWVCCDPTVRSRDDAVSPDILLQGWTAAGEGGLRLQAHFRNGSFAERIMVPTENAVRIGAIETADAARWCALTTMLVPYGGLLAANLQAGETVLISGATGSFGSAGVAVALAMGAGCVIAPGRNEKALEDLARRFGHRVRTVKLLGSEDDDRTRMLRAAPGPIDSVLDLLPPSAPAAAARAAAMTVRPHGTVVLMGGVAAGLELPYRYLMRSCITLRGQWMFPREAVARLVRLIRSGLLTLDHFDVTEFGLDRANEAVAHAAASAGPFKMTVIRP
ncbi:zinc-binding dehydrogenase [Sorangium sp. So ce1128]